MQSAVRPLTRANVLADTWYSEAKRAMAGDTGVQFCDVHQQRFAVIDDTALLRMKQLGIDLLPSPPSRHSMRGWKWYAQSYMADIPNCTRLEFGYRLDIVGVRITDAFIIYHLSGAIQWIWQIWGPQIPVAPAIQPVLSPGLSGPTFRHDDYS